MNKNTATAVIVLAVIGVGLYLYADLKKTAGAAVDTAINAGRRVAESAGKAVDETTSTASKLASMGESGPVTNFFSNLWDGAKYLFTGEMDGVKIQ